MVNNLRKSLSQLSHQLVSAQNYFVKVFSILGEYRILDFPKLVRLGTAYGGWWIPESYLEDQNRKRTVISIGIGHDVSFDKELLESGFQCIALDPISECIEFARTELIGYKSLYLENLGLSTFTGIGLKDLTCNK